MKKSLINAVILAVCAFHNLGYASSDFCTLPSKVPVSPTPSEWKKINDYLTPQVDLCLNNSDFFALYGASLLNLGDISHSIEMLERSLLINPNNGSAMIDYAQALYLKGELLSALQINQQILAHHSIPDYLRTALAKRQKEWESKKHLWQTQFSYLFGKNSNLNNATYIDDYAITFPEFDLVLDILDENRQKSGPFHYLRAASQYYSLLPGGVSVLTLSAQTRESELTSADTDELSIDYHYSTESLNYNHRWEAGINYVRLGDEGLFSAVENSYTISHNDEIPYLTLETDYTSFLSSDKTDDLTFIFEPGVSYNIGEQRFGGSIGLGLNKALGGRKGGDRTIREASLFYDTPLWQGRFLSKISFTKTDDHEGFDPLLSNFEARITSAWTTSVQYYYPVNANLTVHSSYYYRKQDSNIDPFRTKSESIDIGFTYRF